MVIRKQFKFEMAHIVRKAWSQRCSRSIHGHSYLLELFLRSGEDELDNAQMVVDFGAVKVLFNDLIDSFDHSLCFWNLKQDKKIIDFSKKNFERVIVTPFNPSAEMQAEFFLEVFNRILFVNEQKKYVEMNGAVNPFVSSVRIHETTTGWAEAEFKFKTDTEVSPLLRRSENSMVRIIEDCPIHFSPAIQKDWKYPKLLKEILNLG